MRMIVAELIELIGIERNF